MRNFLHFCHYSARCGVFFIYYMCRYRGKPHTAICQLLPQLGTIFIKLGQTLSTRPDIIGERWAKELQRLQDKLPPFPAKQAVALLQKELGMPIDTLFLHFDPHAVAAASIAQVHKANQPDGSVWAVKILRPGIEQKLKRDVRFLYQFAHILNYFFSCKRLKLLEVVDVLAETLQQELDLRLEAAAASELKENTQFDEGIYIPVIDWTRTSEKILTLEWVDAIPINDKEALCAAGLNMAEIVQKYAVHFFNQAYRDGFFHADAHPGNVFVRRDGVLVYVDFGVMGRLDRKNRAYIAKILYGFLKRDYLFVAKIHHEAGYIPYEQSIERFAQACRAIGEPIVGLPLQAMSVSKLLMQLFKITEAFSMETQPQLLLLQKTMVLVEGVGSGLYPEVNMWMLAEPWIQEWAEKNGGVKAFLQEKLHAYKDIKTRLLRLLTQHEVWSDQLVNKGLTLSPETINSLGKKIAITARKSNIKSFCINLLLAAAFLWGMYAIFKSYITKLFLFKYFM